jgi:predicted Ser/Thr protein kinase
MPGESKNFSALEGPERLIGTRIYDFELVSVLGAGGMSVVYRARHPVSLQEVAIKILPPELAVHDELKARFVEEARVLAKLEHPNIVALNNFGDSGARLCLVMQFVEGVTFEKRILEATRLSVHEVLTTGIEVLKALEYAHARSVIHRDIKPSNILVRSDGAVKVTDFGIAKIIGQSRLTSTGQTMGTVRYMSPEQVRGKPVDARSDLYSLGVTLYEGLAGQTPYDGENQFDIMQKHLTGKVPPLASHGAEVPASVEKVLLRAMEKEPKHRFVDATEFRVALEAELARDQTAAQRAMAGQAAAPRRRASRGSSRAKVWAAAAGAVVAIGAGAAILVVKLKPKPAAAVVKTPAKTPAAAPSWPTPHEVAGVKMAVDKTFAPEAAGTGAPVGVGAGAAKSPGVRVQSSRARSDAELVTLRDHVARLERGLDEFLHASTLASAKAALAAAAHPPPLNLAVVPQSILNAPDLWPGYSIKPESTYPSRYVDARRTLFIADTPGFERRELPYGVALHVLTPVAALSDADVADLAEKFADWWLARSSE